MIRSLFTVACFVTLLSITGCGSRQALNVYDLRCENLKNPLGINGLRPRFSWKVSSGVSGTEVKAWQIMVASSRTLLDNDQADLWNPGEITSSEQILVPYGGEELEQGLIYYWKVRVRDREGNLSDWSPVSEFSIGLLDPGVWKAAYIGFPTEAGYREAPQVRGTFSWEALPGRLLVHVNSLGYHELYVNGVKAGEGVLNPAVSQFDRRSLVITYDITSLVVKGENELMHWLGSGWYTDGLPGVVHNGPLVRTQLENVDGRSREILLASDSLWAGRISSYTRQGDWRPNRFGGEIVDGALAKTDLKGDAPGREWNAVSVVEVPAHSVTPQMTEVNRIMESWEAARVVKLAADTFLVDMGRSVTGWTELIFPALQAGQEVVMEYSDHLDSEEKFVNQRQSDRYLAAGSGEEKFINKFNYHGYRYIRISNLGEPPLSVKAHLIHTGYRTAGGFHSSDADLNAIHDMIQYTLRCLSLGGDLVDCPQIERLGYGGDGNASTVTAQMMFDLNPLYRNWLQAWGDCIRDDGGLPHTAPNPYKAGGGPYWCGFVITASWMTYLHYGDAELLQKMYPVMQQWLGFVKLHSPTGLLEKWPDTDYRGWYLGDWATPTGIDQTLSESINLVNNCFVAECYRSMEKIAGVLGKPAEAEQYRGKRDTLLTQIHSTFYHPDTHTYGTATQIDLAFPLLAGVVPDSLKALVMESLRNEIEVNRKGHLATGLVGIPVLTAWTIQNRDASLFASMLRKREYPGYLYMIDNGATTTWEHWNGERSRIHNCYNGIGSWFYQAVGGIRLDGDEPAFRKILLDPQVPEGVTSAETWKETPYGKVFLKWQIRKGNKMSMEMEVPVGIEAWAVIPAGVTTYVSDGKKETSGGSEPFSVRIPAGKHKLSYSLPEQL